MFKTTQIIVMAALYINFSAIAQEPVKPPPLKKQAILGKVVFSTTGEALPGVVIKVTASNHTTVSNDKGEFILTISNGAYNLSVSHIGYKTKNLSIQIPLKEQLVIALETDDNPLNEVQIIGYGQTTKRLNTGSISSITAKDIERQPVTNVLSALSGRMPGVFVQTTNGLPGGNINIQIRGKGSIAAGTNPLYIIDGVPYDGSPPVAANMPMPSSSVAGTISPLNNINPADIASITVLKDADATSIYGSRGSNGVILITTKTTSAGATALNVNLKQGISSLAIKPRLLNLEEYLAIRREGFANENLTPSSDPLSPNYAPDLTIWSQTEGTDWIDHIFGKTANTSDLQARISGGKGTTTFSVNGNYHYENTVVPGFNSYQRGGVTSQLQHRSANNKMTISVSNQLIQQLNQLSNVINGVRSNYLTPPNRPIYLPDGSLNWYPGSNIEAEKNAKNITKTANSITNISLGYALLPQLNFKVSTGYTKTTYDQSQIFPTKALSPGTVNYALFGDNTSNSFIVEPQFDYSLKLKKSKLSFLVGGTLQNRTNDQLRIQASNFKLESLMEDLGSAVTIDARTTSYSNYKYASAFGRFSYNLNDTYIVNATIRRDGSSKFGPGNRYGNFGSIAAAWLFSNLNFIKDKVPFLSYGKLRSSYGTTGNDQIADYGYNSTYGSPGTSIYQDVSSIRPSRISNANFHWETTHKIDIALELGLIKDRIFLSANYYLNQSRDQLVQYTLPQITGFTGYQANLPAVLENKGWEFASTIRIMEKESFNWSGTFNFTLPKNRLKSFENLESSSYRNTYKLGQDISPIFGYKFIDIDPSTGKARYAGLDGQPSNNPYSFFAIGKQSPEYYGGFGSTFNYKKLELNLFAQFAKQQSLGSLSAAPGVLGNNFAYIKNRWSPTNPDSKIPKATARNTDYYFAWSSLNLFDTSFLRLKTISLAYTIPLKVLSKVKINKLRVFADAQNLLTFWDKNAAILDPESGTSSITRNFPALKTIVFGLQFTL